MKMSFTFEYFIVMKSLLPTTIREIFNIENFPIVCLMQTKNKIPRTVSSCLLLLKIKAKEVICKRD